MSSADVFVGSRYVVARGAGLLNIFGNVMTCTLKATFDVQRRAGDLHWLCTVTRRAAAVAIRSISTLHTVRWVRAV